jgi:hypothetical protein
MVRRLKALLVGASLICATTMATQNAQAAGENIGDTQMCVQLSRIDSTPVIDNRTILIKMRASNSYKRIDLVSACPGLRMANGFSHSTSTGDLCTTDPLRVIEPVGATCMIKQIVTISPEEAKALQTKDRRKKEKPADTATTPVKTE